MFQIRKVDKYPLIGGYFTIIFRCFTDYHFSLMSKCALSNWELTKRNAGDFLNIDKQILTSGEKRVRLIHAYNTLKDCLVDLTQKSYKEVYQEALEDAKRKMPPEKENKPKETPATTEQIRNIIDEFKKNWYEKSKGDKRDNPVV